VKAQALCLSIWWAVMAPPVCAEQSYPAVPMPGLESDPTGTVVAEVCTVSVMAGKVKVDLPASTAEKMPALLLTGTFFGWSGPSDPYPNRHFPELEIRVDGAPIEPQDRFEAFMGQTNITNLIKMAEMDPWAISRTPPMTSAYAGNVQVLNALRNVGAIAQSGDDYLAKWTARRLLRIPLTTAPSQQVELEYAARPVISILTADQIDTTSREKSYCISPKQLRPLTRSGSDPTWLTADEFSIPTGIDGKSPRSVILNMALNPAAADSPGYIFFCGPHGKPIAKKTSVARERIETDDQAIVHVLSVTAAARSQPPAISR
jgi:hypothetical protein